MSDKAFKKTIPPLSFFHENAGKITGLISSFSLALTGLALWSNTGIPESATALAVLMMVTVSAALGRTISRMSDDMPLARVKAMSSDALKVGMNGNLDSGSAQQYQQLFESNQDGLIIWTLDPTGHPTLKDVNEAFLSMYGIDRETAFKIVPGMGHLTKESNERWKKDHLASLKKHGYVKQQRLEGVRPDGSHFPILTDTWYAKDEAGRLVSLWGSYRDIGKEIEYEEQLKLFKRVIEQSPSAIAIVAQQDDGNVGLVFKNDTLMGMNGLSPLDEEDGHDVLEEGALPQKLREDLRDARLRGEAFNGISTYSRPDGSTGWMDMRYTPVRDDTAGSKPHWVAFGTDITEQYRSQKEANVLKQAIDQSALSIHVVEMSGESRGANKIMYANSKAAEHCKLPLSKIIGHPSHVLAHNMATAPDQWALAEKAMATGSEALFDHTITLSDAEVLQIEKSIAPVTGDDGKITHWIAIGKDVTEQRKTEVTASILKQAIDQSPLSFVVLNFDENNLGKNQIFYANPTAAQLAELPIDQVIGKPSEVITQNSKIDKKEMAIATAALQSKSQAVFHQTISLSSGEERILRKTIAPVLGHDGSVSHWISIGKDITDQRKAETEAALLKKAIDHSKLAFHIIEVDGEVTGKDRIIYANIASAQLVDEPIENIIGQPNGALAVGATISPEQKSIVDQAIRAQREASFTYTMERASGDMLQIERTIIPVVDDEGFVTHWTSIGRDITEKVKREERLKRDALILDNLSDSVTFADKDGIILDCNPSAVRLFAESENDLIGLNVSQLVASPEEHEAQFVEHMTGLKKGGLIQGETYLKRLTGETFLGEYVSAPLLSKDEELIGWVTVCRDITEERALQTKLQQAQKMEAVGQLTGGIAHDFNNLMGVISGSLQLIEMETEDWALVHKMATTANKSVVRGRDLVDRLLSFSRRQSLQPVVTDVAALINETVELFQRSIGDRHNLALIDDESHPHCLIDPVQLESAILNMALNARDAMEPGGHITIMIRTIDGASTGIPQLAQSKLYACLSVEDDGKGMDKETITKIYEPFFTTKDIGEGSGLGLSMVYGYVKQSGGHIEVQSTVGEGTKFSLYFPVAEDEGFTDSPEDESDRDTTNSARPRILVVEDNEDMLTLCETSLRQDGYRVTTARTGREALKELENNPDIQVAFIDVMLPDGMMGTDLAKVLVEKRPDLRFLFTSGYSNQQILSDAMDMSSVIRKPYNFKEVKEKLAGLLADIKPGNA